jgi:hypothetical protein
MKATFVKNRDLNRVSEAKRLCIVRNESQPTTLKTARAKCYQLACGLRRCVLAISRLVGTLLISFIFAPVIIMAWAAVGIHTVMPPTLPNPSDT